MPIDCRYIYLGLFIPTTLQLYCPSLECSTITCQSIRFHSILHSSWEFLWPCITSPLWHGLEALHMILDGIKIQVCFQLKIHERWVSKILKQLFIPLNAASEIHTTNSILSILRYSILLFQYVCARVFYSINNFKLKISIFNYIPSVHNRIGIESCLNGKFTRSSAVATSQCIFE